MSRTVDTAGPVILWTNGGSEGWSPRSFNSVKEALLAERYTTDFVITRLVAFDVVELQKPFSTQLNK